MLVGIIDGATSQLLGQVLVFIVGSAGLYVNYVISKKNNIAAAARAEKDAEDRKQDAQDQAAILLQRVDLARAEAEVARLAAESKAEEVKAQLELARIELASQQAHLLDKVDASTKAAENAYVAANNTQEKFEQVIANIETVHQEVTDK